MILSCSARLLCDAFGRLPMILPQLHAARDGMPEMWTSKAGAGWGPPNGVIKYGRFMGKNWQNHGLIWFNPLESLELLELKVSHSQTKMLQHNLRNPKYDPYHHCHHHYSFTMFYPDHYDDFPSGSQEFSGATPPGLIQPSRLPGSERAM
jgi:hypothetical protein